jgi:acyl carrier protein
MTELEQRVREVIASVLPRAELALTVALETPLRSVGFDSLALMELIANLELAFDLTVLEEDLDRYTFRTTAEILHYVAAKTQSRPQPVLAENRTEVKEENRDCSRC